MYEYIRGRLAEKNPHYAIIEAGGIGYRLTIPLSTYTNLPSLNANVELYLSHIVREDSETLFAFLTKEERNLFEQLLSISGIGPKTACAVVGHLDVASFQRAIATSDHRLLSKIPGIGKKTAERLVLEMKDKLNGPSKKTKTAPSLPQASPLATDAMLALINLGYAPTDAHEAVHATLKEKEETDLGRLITKALQRI